MHTFQLGSVHSRLPVVRRCTLVTKHQANMASAPVGIQAPQRMTLPPFEDLKGVLFDIDGTMTDSDTLHRAAFVEILLEVGFNNGVPIDETFYNAHISGRHNPDITSDLFPDWSEERRQQFADEKEARFRALAASVLHPIPGLLDFIRWINKQHISKAAVTNAPRANMELMLSALHLRDEFEVVVLGEECERAKPYPDPYLVAAAKLGLQPSDPVIVIEDSPSGVAAAAAANMPCIGITTGHSDAALRAAGACDIIKSYLDLVPLMRSASKPFS